MQVPDRVLFGTRPRLATEIAVLASGSAVVPHVVVALDQYSVTAAPWLSGWLEPVALLVGLGALWPLAFCARYAEWVGILGCWWLAGTAAIGSIPVVCNVMWAGKHPARPGPTPLEGGCIPAEVLPVYLAMAMGVGTALFAVNYAHWRLVSDSTLP